MRPIQITVIFILLNVLTCCHPEKNVLIREINVIDPPTSENLSSLIDSYEIIQLDRIPDAYIANPGRTFYTDSLILIKNGSNQNIVIFDNNGKYLNSIDKRGRGPNEYLYITDFTFNTDDKTVSIYDNDKLKKYNLDGEYISEYNLGFRPSKVTELDTKYSIIEKVMPSGDSISDFYIRLVNDDFKTIVARNPLKPLSGPGFGTEGQNFRTSLNGDHAYFFSYTGDTVYHINHNSIKPVIAFKFKRNIITITNGTGEYDVDPNEALRYLSFFEIGDLNLLFYNFKNEDYCFAFNSSNSNSKLYRSNFGVSNVYDKRANILIDAFYLEEFIEKNDPEKERCLNITVLEAIINDSIKDFQCVVKIKFKEL